MRFNHLPTIGIFAALLWGNLAQAALHDRGNGLIYDDVLNVTWVQDANLAASRNFGIYGMRPDGRMGDCAMASRWIEAMNAARYKGYDDWQLPKASPVNGNTWNDSLSYNGSTDNAYNISAPGSAYPGSHTYPLAHLHYRSLGNQGWYDLNGDRNVQGCPIGINGCLRNTGPFINMQPGIYMYDAYCTPGSRLVLPPPPPNIELFNFRTGQQNRQTGWEPFAYVLPYRPGDVVRHVPTLSPWLLGAMAGLLLVLGGYRLHRRSSRSF